MMVKKQQKQFHRHRKQQQKTQPKKKAEEDAKLAIILGSKWLRNKKITKRGLKRILDGEMLLNDADMKQIEKIKKNVGWGVPTPKIEET